MGGLASINIKFFADLAQFSSQMQNATRQLKKQGEQMQAIGRDMSLAISLPIAGLSGASLAAYGELDSLKRGLTSVEGSARLAGAEFKNLIEVAKLPGLGLEEASRGSVNLQAAGFSADEARESLLAFGNALATVGKGKRELDLVILALTQLNNKSSGFGQDLRQLTEQLPQLRGALTDAFGTADSEEIAKLGVTGKQVVQLLTKEFSKLPKVTGGWKNAMENASDSIRISMADLGETINKSLNLEGIVNAFADSLSDLSKAFQSLSPDVQKLILGTAAIAAAIGPVLVGVGALLKVIPLASAALTAFSTAAAFVSANFVVIAAGLTVAFAIYKIFSEKTVELTAAQKKQAEIQKEFNALSDEATRSITKQRIKLDELVVTARNANEPMAKRKAAIQEINKISPEYLGNLTLETIRTDAATIAINKYNEALFKGALARAAQSKIDHNAERRVAAQLKFEQQTYEYNRKKLEAQVKGQAELQKFFEAENANQAMALTRYEDKLQLLDEEDARLAKILGSNKEYIDLLHQQNTEIGGINEKLAKPGTIAYYEEQIKKLKELQTEFETTPEGIRLIEDRVVALQEKIDRLKGVRAEVKVAVPEIKPMDDIWYSPDKARANEIQAEIDRLKQLQSAYVEGSQEFKNFQDTINGYEFTLQMTVDPTQLIVANEIVDQSLLDMQSRFEQFRENSKIMANAVADSFSSMANRFVDSLGLAETGWQGFAKGLAQTVTKIISMMLAQSMSQAIAGAVASGTATGPGAIFTTPAFIAEALSGLFSAFAAIPKFETGGIVGGNSLFGDRNLVRVNSGEWILNQLQQEKLKGMLRTPRESVKVVLGGGFELDGTKLRLVLDRTDKQKNRMG